MDANQLDPGLNSEVRQGVGQQRPQPLSANKLLARLAARVSACWAPATCSKISTKAAHRSAAAASPARSVQ
jgi:hypothetical protein